MMFVRPDFLAASACARIRSAMDRGRASRAEIYTDGYRVDEEMRRAFDVDVNEDVVAEVQRALEAGRTEVARFFAVALSADEGPGFLRYEPGDFYRTHRDVLPGADEEFPRRISIVVFLTSAGADCEGGSLRVYDPHAHDIIPRAGTLVAFPSETPHEVLPVTAGVRDTVVDWFY